MILLCLLLSGGVRAQQNNVHKVDFRRADSLAAIHKGEGLNSLPILAYKLTASLSTEVERFRAIYTWVSTNIDNDYEYYRKNSKKRKKWQHDSLALVNWNRQFRPKVFKKMVEEQKTICTGYAYLVRELATLAGIASEIVDGYGRTVASNIGESGIANHSWNAVQLNGQWYLCDATWSSGSISQHEGKVHFVRNYNDGYFLAEPALFVKNHYPSDTTWILMKRKPKLEEFLRAPLVYRSAFSHGIIPVEPTTMNVLLAKEEDFIFSFKMTDTTHLDRITLELSRGTDHQVVTPTLISCQDEVCQFRYSFSQLGSYDVHVRVGKDDIVTYTVRVERGKR